jgi:hypothetical protein
MQTESTFVLSERMIEAGDPLAAETTFTGLPECVS